jgi:hypothetical protein
MRFHFLASRPDEHTLTLRFLPTSGDAFPDGARAQLSILRLPTP